MVMFVMVLAMIFSAAIARLLVKESTSEALRDLDSGPGLLICCSLGAAVVVPFFAVVSLLGPGIDDVFCLGVISLEAFWLFRLCGKRKGGIV